MKYKKVKPRKPRGEKCGGQHEVLVTRLLESDEDIRVNGHSDDIRRAINAAEPFYDTIIDDGYYGAVTWLEEIERAVARQSTEEHVIYFDVPRNSSTTCLFGGRLPDAHKIRLVTDGEYPKIEIDWYEVEVTSYLTPHKWADVLFLLLCDSCVDGSFNKIIEPRLHLIDRYFNRTTLDSEQLSRVMGMLGTFCADCYDIEMSAHDFPSQRDFNKEFQQRLASVIAHDPEFEPGEWGYDWMEAQMKKLGGSKHGPRVAAMLHLPHVEPA